MPITIANIFDRSVIVLVRRWRIALIGTVVPAGIDAAARLVTHSASLWLVLTIARIGFVAYLLSVQVHEFAAEANDPPIIRIAPSRGGTFARSLGALVFNISLGFVFIGSLALAGAATYRGSVVLFIGIAIVGVALFPLILLICSTTYSTVILRSLGSMKAVVLASRCIFQDVLRSWLLGASMAIVVVGWYALVEGLVRLIAVTFGPTWLVGSIPLLEAPATAFGTVLSAVIAIDYFARSTPCSTVPMISTDS